MRPPLRRPRHLAAVVAVLALAVAAPAPASARDGGGKEARVDGTCGRGATSELRLRARDGRIRVEFEVRTRRRGERWRVVLVHERRVVWRGRARTRSGRGSFRIRRSLPDLDGADRVTARASGPRGNACEAGAVLRGG